MKKLTFLSIVSIILVSVNITLLVYLFQNQSNNSHLPPHSKRPKNLIIEKLHFDTAQEKQYQALIKQHRSSVKETENAIYRLKNKLYKTLNKSSSEAEKQELIEAIGKKHQELESIHLNHFNDIRQLCKEDQLKHFDEFIDELSQLFRRPPPSHRR